jgi:hypothetical protein
MALVISSAAGISDGSTSCAIVVTGKLNSARLVTFEVKIQGVLVGSGSTYGTSGSAIGITALEIYNNAMGHLLAGGATIHAYEWDSLESNITQTAASVTRDITITARNSALSVTSPTTGSPINLNLADPVNILATWTRPSSHAAFLGRLKAYVWTGTAWSLIFNRYGYTNNISLDVVYMGYDAAIIAAMGGVSPRNFKLELYTQFDDGTADNWDIGSLNATVTVTSGFIYAFGGKIKVFSSSFLAKPIKAWSGSVFVEKPLKVWDGTSWVRSNS